MSYLTDQEIIDTFVNANLKENYQFDRDDLIKLANRFIDAARPKIVREERSECIKVVRSLNTLVADKLAEIKGAP